VVLFEISGCPYCRTFAPRFLDFARERSGDLRLLRVKLDDPRNPLWAKHDILAVPTALAFSGGRVVARADSGLGLGLSRKKWAEFCAGL
jgi:thioredoxin-like negative regulator of GroEL